MAGAARSSSSCSPPSPAHGGSEMSLQRPQPLPWLQVAKAMAGDGGDDQDLAGSAAAAKAGKKRRSPAQAGAARGVKVLVRGLVEMVGKRFDCSIPAVKFGHVAYIR